eukprot:TRINITY_DN11115_c0_g1_i1.p1 TRINITY_DN11115_c0_g1~~TRINITY_DN11115_c0_g1_i1.p1  ORF type:complete len:528 (-),score=107.01 TRINITY_DN11115_c0_g1_i1:8-1591(-)
MCIRDSRWFDRTGSFSPLENVVVQTVAVAAATMPLAAGFVGVLPAFSMLDPPVRLSVLEQLGWCTAMAFFGTFFAVPLRRRVILEEKLAFPSGSATAKLIQVLHNEQQQWHMLWASFGVSFTASLVCFVVPSLENWSVGTWVGLPALSVWHWTIRPSFAYVGQGMIMGTRAALSMLAGAVLAWAVMGPLAKQRGWAPGEVSSWHDGAQGWLVWLSIGLMLAESLTSLALASCTRASAAAVSSEGCVDQAPAQEQVPQSWYLAGLFGSVALALPILSSLFSLPVWQGCVGVLLSCLVTVLAVRALGQTDMNPVSGVGKLSQIVFAVLAPGHIVANLVAGALAEAGATQAGDLMQDLKTGHVLGSSPRAQFKAQLIGSAASVFVTVAAYQLYDTLYQVPSEAFPAPVAHIWKDVAVLMQGGMDALPDNAQLYAGVFSVLGAVMAAVEVCAPHPWSAYSPSGIAVGVGMYITPDWTIPRVCGAVVVCIWTQFHPESCRRNHLLVASGFVLGEGIMSILALVLKAFGMPTF